MADVEMIIDALRQSSVNHQWVVVLKEKIADRYLPVYIGSAQAETIKRELIDVSTPRPLDNDLIYRGIDAVNPEVKMVKLDKFDNNVFSAKLVLAAPGKPNEVDCPPATALAIAARTKAPIFTDEIILSKAGISVCA
jgi:bifunctional DNase/RNase